MINRINTLRAVAKNLKSHLCMEGKTKIAKPGAIIPGAVAAAGVVITLETKDNKANISVRQQDKEVQKADFEYVENPNGYKLVSATSKYYYDDTDRKEIQQNYYYIEPDFEQSYEHFVNYVNGSIKPTTWESIDKINSSVAHATGYKSSKIDYDPQESHTYGKKSLKRDMPALLKILDVIAPNSEFTLKMKDKLKKDKKTSLVAFEATDTKTNNGIVRGFMSANGDSVSYHIDTDDMTIVGEQALNKNFTRLFLKPEKVAKETEKTNDEKSANAVNTVETDKAKEDKSKDGTKAKSTAKKTSTKKTAAKSAAETKKETKQSGGKEAAGSTAPRGTTAQAVPPTVTHVLTKEYYANLIFDIATSKKMNTRQKVENYKEILASAYLDGYDADDLGNILSGNGMLNFSRYCKTRYVHDAIKLAEDGAVKKPEKTLDDKIKDLKNIKIDIEDDALNDCVKSMVNIISQIKIDANKKEAYVDNALNLLNNSSSKNYITDLLGFIKEISLINEDMKLHYEIYQESVNIKQAEALRSQIEQMINNLSDTKHHKNRGEFLTQLYITNDIKELEQLKHSVQILLNEPLSEQVLEEIPEADGTKFSLSDLSKTNQKLVRELLNCTSPKTMNLRFNSVTNLLEDIGFELSNVSGTHYKYTAPKGLIFNGERQDSIIITTHGVKADNPAQIDDLIRICKQYYPDVE